MAKQVTLSAEAKISLDRLKKEYSFSSYNNCIVRIDAFFKDNNLSPKDKVSNNASEVIEKKTKELKGDIQDLKKYIAADSQSLRRRHGAIEKEYFQTFNRKIETIYQKIIIENSLKKERMNEQDTTTTQVSNLDNNSSQKDKIKIKQQFDSLNSYQKIVDTQEGTFRNLRHIINKIKENISYEKSTFGKPKTVLNITKEELELLYNIKL
jgi:hypothetical protein